MRGRAARMRLYAKNTVTWERVFFIPRQALEAPREIGLRYDEVVSGPIIYSYVEGNPISYTDPEGLNPVLAVYRAGMTGYRIGEAINPYVQPYLTRVVEGVFGDPLAPASTDPLLAQNNKQTRKRIQGLQDQIDDHNNKLDKEPNCPASNHWRNEIKVWQSEIERLRLRLPNGK